MKQSKMRILCLLLTAVMLLSLTACGKDKKEENSNVMKFDDCELVYKSACIMDDFDGNDALVVTLDFTNTSSQMSRISGLFPKRPYRMAKNWRSPRSMSARIPSIR